MGRGGVWELAVPLCGCGKGQRFDVLWAVSAPVEGHGQLVPEADGLHIYLSPLGFRGGEQVGSLGQLPEPHIHQARQGFIAD